MAELVLAPRVFGKEFARDHYGNWFLSVGALEYEIRTNQPHLPGRCITWLYKDKPLAGTVVRVQGRSVPFVGSVDECAAAIESELRTMLDALERLIPNA